MSLVRSYVAYNQQIRVKCNSITSVTEKEQDPYENRSVRDQ